MSTPSMPSTQSTPSTPPRSETSFLYRFFRFFFRVSLRVYCRQEAYGAENVPSEGGFMLVSNHASYLDPPLIGCRARRGLYYMAKRELFRIPVFGRLIRNVNAVPVDRGQVRRGSMREYVGLMRDGHVLVVFPEGTRSHDGRLRAFKPGVAMIAAQARVPCIPAYIQGSFDSWPRHRRFPRPAKIRVFYGAPFDLPERAEGMATRDYYEICAQEMHRRVDALRVQAEEVEETSPR
ncbi:1-acyl-sn-glycerol-3-phosphate acyltransferase [Candidatus Sumerlaeota bacterium]|nr:1-acyl-sn-glycerol-3-phosphate acyltransferase [Candidatus Sumerlaeota bacterium]